MWDLRSEGHSRQLYCLDGVFPLVPTQSTQSVPLANSMENVDLGLQGRWPVMSERRGRKTGIFEVRRCHSRGTTMHPSHEEIEIGVRVGGRRAFVSEGHMRCTRFKCLT